MANYRLSVTLKAPEIVLLLDETGTMKAVELQMCVPSYEGLIDALEGLTVKSVSGTAYGERCKKVADALIDKAFKVVDDLDVEQDRVYSFDSSVVKLVFERVPGHASINEYTDEELLDSLDVDDE